MLADCKVQKNNHTLNRKFCINFWAKFVEQLTYNSVLLSAQVNIKSKVWSHIHEMPEHWWTSTSFCHYQRYSSNILHCAM